MEEKDKLENGSQGRSMSDADKEYYADLYNDLPKEVQDILIQKRQHTAQDVLSVKMWKK